MIESFSRNVWFTNVTVSVNCTPTFEFGEAPKLKSPSFLQEVINTSKQMIETAGEQNLAHQFIVKIIILLFIQRFISCC